MVPLLFLDLRTVLGDGRHGRSWGAQGWLSLAPALAPAPCTTSARNQVPGRAKDRSWAGGEGVSLGSGQDLYSPSCSSPHFSPTLAPQAYNTPCKPALLHSQLQSQTIFSIEFIYSFNKHSQNPVCQEVRLSLSQPLEAHRHGSKGLLVTDLGSSEGLGVWVGF